MALDLKPLGHGAELLAAVMKAYGWLRGALSESWYAVTIWGHSVPRATRVGLDVRLLHAILAAALVWQWPRLAALTAL
eukprot:8942919-Lingulodinium_polyedra.AAC.1